MKAIPSPLARLSHVSRKGRCGCPGPARKLQFYGEGPDRCGNALEKELQKLELYDGIIFFVGCCRPDNGSMMLHCPIELINRVAKTVASENLNQ